MDGIRRVIVEILVNESNEIISENQKVYNSFMIFTIQELEDKYKKIGFKKIGTQYNFYTKIEDEIVVQCSDKHSIMCLDLNYTIICKCVEKICKFIELDDLRDMRLR